MTSGVYGLLADIANRCSIRNEKVLRKSKELIALLHSKQSLNCSDTCKAVVCLELACSLSSCTLNREEAIKYSGCKKKFYVNIYNNISKLLNLDKIYSVKEICLLMGISDFQIPVTKLLQKYKSASGENDNEFEHPMYACAAVLAFCRSNKVKVDIVKLVEISRIKKLELDELAKKFQAVTDVKMVSENGPKDTESSPLSEALETKDIDITPRKRTGDANFMTDDEYMEWKKKMLED